MLKIYQKRENIYISILFGRQKKDIAYPLRASEKPHSNWPPSKTLNLIYKKSIGNNDFFEIYIYNF